MSLKLIKVNMLDKLMEKFNISRVAIMKIDTEGNDYKVLLGAKEVLEVTDIVIFEVMFKIIEYGNTPQDALIF